MRPPESRIIINSPYRNTDRYRRYTSPDHTAAPYFAAGGDTSYDIWIPELVKSGKVTAEKFPRAVDLFAGDGSWARRLIDNGWKPENITCIDIYVSPTPLVEGVNWRHMNLVALYEALKKRAILPTEVESLRGGWDLTTMSYGSVLYGGDQYSDKRISRFFTRPKGIMLVQRTLHRNS